MRFANFDPIDDCAASSISRVIYTCDLAFRKTIYHPFG
nr:hypothetical protein [Salmonella enterica subsp. enterica serovar Thompson]